MFARKSRIPAKPQKVSIKQMPRNSFHDPGYDWHKERGRSAGSREGIPKMTQVTHAGKANGPRQL